MIYAATAILSVLCIYLAVRLSIIRSQMKKIKSELIKTRDNDYDRQITVTLSDRRLTEMAAEINGNLSYQKQLKIEAERAEKTLKQSVSDIAHDLRTPLTVIKGNLQLMESEAKLSGRENEYLRICLEKTDILREMTDNFFEMSVLESSDLSAELKRTDATALFLQFMADNEAVISGAGLVPDIHFPEKSIFINADDRMLLRMLGNLLNNIIKYAHGTFSAEITESGGKCIIRFSNSISAHEMPDTENMFSRTYRGDKARRKSGAGLGLYIVKLLAEKQKAKVFAEAEKGQLSTYISFELIK